jgi:glycosyltransferase involved in cell wall biosynthesis
MNLLLFNLRVDRDDTALGFTTDWINEIAKHFDHVTVITMYRGTLAVASNVDVISAGLEKGWSKPRRVFEFYLALLRALGSRRYDCCFAHMMPLFLVLAGPVLKLNGIPACLWYAHNHRPPILPLATAFADKVLASTRTAFPMETKKLRIIGQGIDTNRFKPAPRKPGRALTLITVGRISRVKNISLMLRAVARLRAERPNMAIEFLVFGEPLTKKDGEYLNECLRLSQSLGIESVVKWMPSVPFHTVHHAYRHGDVFLSANDNGLDKAILEAMASGLAVVAMHPAVAEPLGAQYAINEQAFGASLLAACDLDAAARVALGERLREHVLHKHGLAQLGHRVADELKEMTA